MSSIEIKVPIEELRKRKLMLATPMYGGMAAGMFTRSVADLAAMCTHYGVQLQFYFLFNESLITRARNYCCDEFMRSPSTHLLFVDSDIGFNPQDVFAMLALMSDESEYDVMAAPYAKKCISWEKIYQAVNKGYGDPLDPVPEKRDPNILERFVGDYVFNPKGNQTEIPLGQPVEVLEAGTGFMMIRRKTFEKYREHFQHKKMYRPDHVRTAHFDGSREIMMYFQAAIDQYDPREDLEKMMEHLSQVTDIQAVHDYINVMKHEIEEKKKKFSKRYLSEDYLFCQEVQQLGMKVWFCPWMKLSHVGSYIFGGSLADLAALGAPATADAAQLQRIREQTKQVPQLK